jgi:hypothetical protein
MTKLKKLYMAPPPDLLKEGESETPIFKRICDEQPNAIVFLTNHSVEFPDYRTWTALAIDWAFRVWENYLGNGLHIPTLPQDTFNRQYHDNQRFVTEDIASIRDLSAFNTPLSKRAQLSLRGWMMATVFDITQNPMIDPSDIEKDPELVESQNLAHILVGTVIDPLTRPLSLEQSHRSHGPLLSPGNKPTYKCDAYEMP